MLLIRHICQLNLLRLSDIKKRPNSYESGRLVSEISVWGVSDLFILLGQGLKIWLIMIKTTLSIYAKFSRPIN